MSITLLTPKKRTATTPANFVTTNLQQWFSARLETGYSDGDPIGTFVDQSGNSRNMTSSGSNRPTWKTSISNGQAAYFFDGSDDYVSRSAAFMSAWTAAEMWVMLKRPSSMINGNGWLKYDGNTLASHNWFGDGQIFESTFSNTRDQISFGIAGAYELATQSSNGALYIVCNNGASNGRKVLYNGNNSMLTTTHNFSVPSTDCLIGASSDQASGSVSPNRWHGWIMEFLAYDTILSSSDRNQNLNELESIYGITTVDF